MLRRTFLSAVLSTAALLVAFLPLVACGGSGGGDPIVTPAPTTGIDLTNSATDSAAQPNTHAIVHVSLTIIGGMAIERDVSIAAGATFLVEVAPGSYRINSVRYDDAVLLAIQPPVTFTLAEGDKSPYTAVRQAPP